MELNPLGPDSQLLCSSAWSKNRDVAPKAALSHLTVPVFQGCSGA